MLDRNKLVNLLDQLTGQLFSEREKSHVDLAYEIWQIIAADSSFKECVLQSESSFLLPRWQGNLSDVIQAHGNLSEYVVLGVDGSQVYPERHLSGIGCFVINIGGCLLRYGSKSSVDFFSAPQLFISEKIVEDLGHFSTDMVDLKRESCEFEQAFDKASIVLNLLKQTGVRGRRPPFVFLFDGSLVFWHLEGKPQNVRDVFLHMYFEQLQKFHDQAIVIAGYISMPKSRELINLARLGLCRFENANCIKCHSAFTHFPCQDIDQVIDTQLCRLLLPENYRTTIFYSTSKVVEHYPAHLRPAFFYLNVGSEVVRIEVPSWVANDPTAIDLVCAIAIDQAIKGRGYPVALAEAHEQAVIRGADRDFFYHVMGKRSIEYRRCIFMSPKSIKKRGIGI
jgi:hypothetical protein